MIANRQRRALAAHLKYVPPSQRDSTFESLPKRRRLQDVSLSMREEERMPPLVFQAHHVEIGLFRDMSKAPCAIPQCKQRSLVTKEPVLTKFAVAKSVRRQGSVGLTATNGLFRSGRCRTRYSATFGNPGFIWDRNLHVGVAARRYCVEGIPQTTAVLLLKADPKVVQRAYDSARDVMYFDAMRRQANIRFGGRGSITTGIEADCSVFLKWREVHEGRVWFFYWVVIGVMERGSPHTLWLKVLGDRKALVVRFASIQTDCFSNMILCVLRWFTQFGVT